MWDKIKSIVGAVAPVLGGALGGPFGALAGSVISKIVTGKEDAAPEEILKSLGNPEALLALKKEDHAFEIRLKELEVRDKEISIDDTKSARGRQIKMAKAGKADRMMPVIAFLCFSTLFFLIWIVAFHPIPEAFKVVLEILIGGAITQCAQIVQFYFGSSAGSRIKDTKLIQ